MSKNYYGLAKELPKKDKRQKKWTEQRRKYGFDDTETWALDFTIAKFIVPRLKKFKEIKNGFPLGMSLEAWDKILDKMILAFELKTKTTVLSTTEWKKINAGLKLFAKYFNCLWW